MLYNGFFGYAMSVAMIYSAQKDAAIEIVNDSFLKVFSEIGKYDSSLPFKSWFRKIVINTAIDRFRRNHKVHPFVDSEAFHVADEAPGVISQLTAQDIMELLNKLPDVHKIVFQLFEIEGFGHDKIAEMLNIPESSSRVYLTRAKKKLRDLFPVHFNVSYEKFGN